MKGKYLILLFVMALASCERNQDVNEKILKFYGDAYEDVGYSIASVDDGYVITGLVTVLDRSEGNYISGSAKKMGIIRAGTDGNVIWQNSYGDLESAVGSKVIALDDGSVIATGYVLDADNQKDIFVVKVNADGSGQIEKVFENAGNQYGIDIIQTGEGFLIMGSTDVQREPYTESTGNSAGKKDILFLRINNNLEQIAAPFATGFTGNDEGVAVKAGINGGYVVVGTTDRSEPGQAGNNIIILKVNQGISTTQTRIIGGASDEYASDLEVLQDGYFIAGTVGAEESNQKGIAWGISADISESEFFEREIDIEPGTQTKSSFSIKAITRYKTNYFVMAGQIAVGTSTRMLIFITDAEGNYIDDKKLVTGGTGAQVAYDVISDDNNNIIAVGKDSYENNSMISLIKFCF